MTVTFKNITTGEEEIIKNVTHIEAEGDSVLNYKYNIFDEAEDKIIKLSMITRIDWED